VPPDREASLDFQGFALAFEQLFNRNVPLTPEALDELKAAVDSGNDEDVSMANWNFFHKQWTASASMAGHLDGRVAKKRARADLDAEKKRLEDVAKKREDDFQQRLVKATQENLEKARSQPTLLAKDAQAKQAAKSKWFEARESAAKAAAQYRSLDPAKWADVVADVGGLPFYKLRSWVERTGAPGGMQEARYESGLDDSPMYDCATADQGDGCDFFDRDTGFMELADVGMTSMAAQEAYALATLAEQHDGKP